MSILNSEHHLKYCHESFFITNFGPHKYYLYTHKHMFTNPTISIIHALKLINFLHKYFSNKKDLLYLL